MPPQAPAHFADHRFLLSRGLAVGVTAAILAILVVAAASLRTLQSRSRAVDDMQLTMEVLQQIEMVASTLKDAETGQRGYLLTQQDRQLELYNQARTNAPVQAARLVELTRDLPDQTAHAAEMVALITRRLEFAAETLRIFQAGDQAAAVALVRSGRGIATMDRIRGLVVEMTRIAKQRLTERQSALDRSAENAVLSSVGGSSALLILTIVAAFVMSRDFRARQAQVWLRSTQMELAQQIQGERQVDVLGNQVITYLAETLNVPVGAIHAVDEDGTLRRIGGYAVPDGGPPRLGSGLAGQAAKTNQSLHITDVPPDYLPISSSLGSGRPAQLIVVPASVDGTVQAVIELGFFRPVWPIEQELVARVSELLAVAVRSARERSDLEALLGKTQRQAEELQSQQEELRVNNEELEEQARALRESQARLENQQSELEQINAHLEEQTHLLEAQKDDLSRTQALLSDQAGELQRANRYKSEFLANMSHELRTPLNSALILATLLADNRDGNLTDEQVTFARTIHDAGNDLLALINDVLDLAKIESGKMDLSIEPVPLVTIVDSLARTFELAARQKHLGFTATIDPAVPSQIESDGQRLGQVLKNLLSNAVKFTDRGSISLRVSADAHRIHFAVEDTGIGIPPHQQAVIFEAFRQADGSTHRKYGGTGLGLSISRELAQLLGGELAVRSESGRGSTFTLTVPRVLHRQALVPAVPAGTIGTAVAIPLAPVARAQPPSSAERPLDDDRARLTSGSRRLLIIEDDQRFASILRDVGRDRGFECVLAASAADGLSAASAIEPDAILLDVNLPDTSGLGVLDQLKRNPRTRHVPVHIISVEDHAHQALERGAIGYAIKPIPAEHLATVFRRLETKLTQGTRRVLVVEHDERQRDTIRQLLAANDVEITGVGTAADALGQLRQTTFDCVVMDLALPDLSGVDLLAQMASSDGVSFPPVIVYTGRTLSADEEHQLRRFSRSIIIKDARSPERLLDEVTLFLHQVEATMPAERQRMLKAARARDTALEQRRILIVDDDARNIFALSRVLEPRGAAVDIARNGREALVALERGFAPAGARIDLVLMDIMMPEMDGITAMQEIRRRGGVWGQIPIIALTAKAMKDDQERCRAAGANDYIAKPFDVEQLLSLIRVWMPKQ